MSVGAYQGQRAAFRAGCPPVRSRDYSSGLQACVVKVLLPAKLYSWLSSYVLAIVRPGTSTVGTWRKHIR